MNRESKNSGHVDKKFFLGYSWDHDHEESVLQIVTGVEWLYFLEFNVFLQ